MNKFMREAVKEAYKGIKAGHGGPFGTVIVKDGKIIARGHNHVVSNNDPTCHGEIDAIRKACKKLKTFDLSGCELYTSGYPCPMCFCAILWANIEKVYYGCNTTDTEIIGFRDKAFEESIPNRKITMCEEVDREECLKLYRDYAAIQDKTSY
ncbi:MAG: nucleoside deaminase [Acholeplasmatales bacterium]|nr:nucleoside deaminase [Acholeplasmatales bacterium]